jgi:L-ascorbate metabolism protein UlaG (beta-lactamase superfamily)
VRNDRLERLRRSPNFRQGAFRNQIDTPLMMPGRTLDAIAEWLWGKKKTRPPRPLPTVGLVRGSFSRPPLDDLRICWLGHSTVLLELEGVRMLFDPVWARRSSPSRFVGPARFQPVPLAVEELPALDAVVISHDHYDHLDRQLIERLARAQREVIFHVPLGVGAHLEEWGIAAARTRELDWWQEASVAEGRVRLVAAPARHFSGRGLLDRNRTLWASWAAIGKRRRAYFGGDGGYGRHFVEIGTRLGPFDLTMLEIGAYHPSWEAIHLGPENALRAHRDLGGSLLLPIHWGTFDLAVHAWDEPIRTLAAAAPASGAELLVPRIGELAHFSSPPARSPWWDRVA